MSPGAWGDEPAHTRIDPETGHVIEWPPMTARDYWRRLDKTLTARHAEEATREPEPGDDDDWQGLAEIQARQLDHMSRTLAMQAAYIDRLERDLGITDDA